MKRLNEKFNEKAENSSGSFHARITAQYKNLYKVETADAEMLAEISGKVRYSSGELTDYPAVGDYVIIDREHGKAGNAIIHQILNRRSAFVRKAAGTSHDLQVVAANIDTVFICMALDADFNIRRLERYLSIAWDSGAMPVIILTKSDLCENVSAKLAEIEKIASGADIAVTSSITGEGFEFIKKYVKDEKTVAFIGSSGVGKSSLINCLIGNDNIETREIRKDGKGRHTTTRRELFRIPSGGYVIDTPGMRELGVENVDLGKTFSEISTLADMCKFKDCKHENEPGCAVRKAIEEGSIDADRLESFRKLQKEAKYDGLNSRQIEKEKMDAMFSEFGGVKNAKEYVKSKKKRT